MAPTTRTHRAGFPATRQKWWKDLEGIYIPCCAMCLVALHGRAGRSPQKRSGNRQRTSSSHLTLYQLQARPVPASNHQSHRSWDFMRLRYRNMRLNLGCNASMEQSFNLYRPLYCGPRES
jgi:hypothetical protein